LRPVIYTVIGGIRNIESAGAGIGFDHVVKAARYALNFREGDGLMRCARVLDVDDRGIVAAGEQQIAAWSDLQ
jgi:hypothetical protein